VHHFQDAISLSVQGVGGGLASSEASAGGDALLVSDNLFSFLLPVQDIHTHTHINSLSMYSSF
jgi:hypothetical protein